MLDIQLSTVLFTVINLLILYALLKKFLFGRVNRVLEERAALVAEQVDQAKARNDQAATLKAQYEASLNDARAEAEGIVAQAKTRGETEYQAILSQAQADARRVQTEAQARAQSDRAEMLRGARQEVAQLAMLAAAKAAQSHLDPEADRALLRDFLKEAGESK